MQLMGKGGYIKEGEKGGVKIELSGVIFNRVYLSTYLCID